MRLFIYVILAVVSVKSFASEPLESIMATIDQGSEEANSARNDAVRSYTQGDYSDLNKMRFLNEHFNNPDDVAWLKSLGAGGQRPYTDILVDGFASVVGVTKGMTGDTEAYKAGIEAADRLGTDIADLTTGARSKELFNSGTDRYKNNPELYYRDYALERAKLEARVKENPDLGKAYNISKGRDENYQRREAKLTNSAREAFSNVKVVDSEKLKNASKDAKSKEQLKNEAKKYIADESAKASAALQKTVSDINAQADAESNNNTTAANSFRNRRKFDSKELRVAGANLSAAGQLGQTIASTIESVDFANFSVATGEIGNFLSTLANFEDNGSFANGLMTANSGLLAMSAVSSLMGSSSKGNATAALMKALRQISEQLNRMQSSIDRMVALTLKGFERVESGQNLTNEMLVQLLNADARNQFKNYSDKIDLSTKERFAAQTDIKLLLNRIASNIGVNETKAALADIGSKIETEKMWQTPWSKLQVDSERDYLLLGQLIEKNYLAKSKPNDESQYLGFGELVSYLASIEASGYKTMSQNQSESSATDWIYTSHQYIQALIKAKKQNFNPATIVPSPRSAVYNLVDRGDQVAQQVRDVMFGAEFYEKWAEQVTAAYQNLVQTNQKIMLAGHRAGLRSELPKTIPLCEGQTPLINTFIWGSSLSYPLELGGGLSPLFMNNASPLLAWLSNRVGEDQLSGQHKIAICYTWQRREAVLEFTIHSKLDSYVDFETQAHRFQITLPNADYLKRLLHFSDYNWDPKNYANRQKGNFGFPIESLDIRSKLSKLPAVDEDGRIGARANLYFIARDEFRKKILFPLKPDPLTGAVTNNILDISRLLKGLEENGMGHGFAEQYTESLLSIQNLIYDISLKARTQGAILGTATACAEEVKKLDANKIYEGALWDTRFMADPYDKEPFNDELWARKVFPPLISWIRVPERTRLAKVLKVADICATETREIEKNHKVAGMLEASIRLMQDTLRATCGDLRNGKKGISFCERTDIKKK